MQYTNLTTWHSNSGRTNEIIIQTRTKLKKNCVKSNNPWHSLLVFSTAASSPACPLWWSYMCTLSPPPGPYQRTPWWWKIFPCSTPATLHFYSQFQRFLAGTWNFVKLHWPCASSDEQLRISYRRDRPKERPKFSTVFDICPSPLFVPPLLYSPF